MEALNWKIKNGSNANWYLDDLGVRLTNSNTFLIEAFLHAVTMPGVLRRNVYDDIDQGSFTS